MLHLTNTPKSCGKLWIQTNGLQEKNGKRKLPASVAIRATLEAPGALFMEATDSSRLWVGAGQMGESRQRGTGLLDLIMFSLTSPRWAGVSPSERILYKQAIHQVPNLKVGKRNSGAGFVIFRHLINLVTVLLSRARTSGITTEVPSWTLKQKKKQQHFAWKRTPPYDHKSCARSQIKQEGRDKEKKIYPDFSKLRDIHLFPERNRGGIINNNQFFIGLSSKGEDVTPLLSKGDIWEEIARDLNHTVYPKAARFVNFELSPSISFFFFLSMAKLNLGGFFVCLFVCLIYLFCLRAGFL